MKGNAFSDRVGLVTEWFQSWNSCEQTIALYSLLSKVSATQARFLSLVLEHSLKNGLNSAELAKLEKQANNATYLSSLHHQTEDQALAQLLAHLPLLNPGSTEARGEYMKLLPKVLLGFSEELDYLDQCRQLLSLALVHPAFPLENREALTFWLSQLDRKQKNIIDRKAPSPSNQPSRIYQIKPTPEDNGWNSTSGGRIDISGDLNIVCKSDGFSETNPGDDDEVPKSNSMPPGQTLYNSPSTIEDNDHPMSVPASYDEYVAWGEGMKDVPLWLKSLRLHKYQYLFVDMTYEDMLEMPEDYLTEKGVTKGARTKIILSIRKLARRPETLAEIELDMEKHGRLIWCISELRQMLLTPIKPYNLSDSSLSSNGTRKPSEPQTEATGSGDEEDEGANGGRAGSPTLKTSPNAQHSSSDSELEELLAKDFPHEDLPSLITRAIGKGFSQLMLHTDTNEENLGGFLKLLDSALQHEVFTIDQKNLFFDWKQQCTQTLRVISPKKPSRGGRTGFYTIHGVPSATSLMGNRGNKTRSLRAARVGTTAPNKGFSLPAFARSSSTLPRMSARQLQQPPIPHHTPAFLRPKSMVYPSSPNGKAYPLASATSSLTFSSSVPPPLPPRTRPDAVNDSMYMNDLPQRVAEHALDDHTDN